MEETNSSATPFSALANLLPIGTMFSHGRVFIDVNDFFAGIFGYPQQDLLGSSIARLYPSQREYRDRGDQWFEFMRESGEHCDERVMVRKGDEPIRVRVRGRCKDRRDPYELVACTFEVVETTARVQLNAREMSIVELMSEGLTSKQIAGRLSLSFRTVETYRTRLLARTGAKNALQLLTLVR